MPTHPPAGWWHFLRQRRRHVATGKRFQPRQFIIATAGFLVFTALWLALVTAPWGIWNPSAISAVAMKLAGDTLFLGLAGIMAGESRLAVSAPLFGILHLLLFPLLQLAGTLLPFRWKGRSGR